MHSISLSTKSSHEFLQRIKAGLHLLWSCKRFLSAVNATSQACRHFVALPLSRQLRVYLKVKIVADAGRRSEEVNQEWLRPRLTVIASLGPVQHVRTKAMARNTIPCMQTNSVHGLCSEGQHCTAPGRLAHPISSLLCPVRSWAPVGYCHLRRSKASQNTAKHCT
jgi:hypothetical protein